MSSEVKTPEIVPDGEGMPDNSTIVALARAEIDQSITTAKAYPRSIQTFKADMLAMATLDQETAESMYYQLPRDGKLIEGPSIRLAEIAGSCWGNVRYGSRVIEIGDDYLVARGVCMDLQRNVHMEIDVRRRIVTKGGKRFGFDMIQTTGLAACAIALRNAIFKVVPAAYIKPVLEAAKRVAAGDEKTLSARRDAALLYFKTLGVTPDRVFALLEIKGKDDVTFDHLARLQGIRNAIKDGEAKLEEYFPPPGDPRSALDRIAEDTKKKAEPKPPADPAACSHAKIAEHLKTAKKAVVCPDCQAEVQPEREPGAEG